MVDSAAVISAIAAVVSTTGSAQAANEAAKIAAKRAALRQLTVTANEISVEAERSITRCVELKNSYRTLSTFANASGGSRLGMYLDQVNKKPKEVGELSEKAKPFVSSPESLMNGPTEEINSRDITMAQILTKFRGVREDLERDLTSIEAQNKTYRDKAIQGSAR